MQIDDVALRAFFLDVIRQWRDRFDAASPEARSSAIHSLSDLRAPLVADIVVVVSAETELVATAVRLVRDDLEQADRVTVRVLELEEARVLPAPPIKFSSRGFGMARDRDDTTGFLRTAHHAVGRLVPLLRNWRPGRRQTPQSWPSATSGLENPPEVFWDFAGPLDALDVAAHLDSSFRTPSTEPATSSHIQATRCPLSELAGAEQEREGIFREINGSLASLLLAAGAGEVPYRSDRTLVGWWCAPCAPRALVFGKRLQSGDIDLLAGPMYVDASAAEANALIEEEILSAPLERSSSLAVMFAHLRLIEAGRLIWPPPMDYLIGIEVKVSCFDTVHEFRRAEHRRSRPWRRQHVEEHGKIIGQLNALRDAGIDRVSFFHLGITEPRAVSGMQGIRTAALDAGRADDQFPFVFRGPASPDVFATLPDGYGYITKCLAGTIHEAEHDQGATTMSGELQPGRRAVDGYRLEQSPLALIGGDGHWRGALRGRLGTLPSPASAWPVVVWNEDGDTLLFRGPAELPLARRMRAK